MKILGIRHCIVSSQAEELAACFDEQMQFPVEIIGSDDGSFSGALIPAGESRIEMWPSDDTMPPMTMLQILVDDAAAWAKAARAKGCVVQGPALAHGEEIYSLTLPGSLIVSVQSKVSTGGS